jgi:hypothetical protein
MSKKCVKKDLEMVAQEFNAVLKLDPPIDLGEETTVKFLEADIKDVFENVLEERDILSDRTIEVMGVLGLVRGGVDTEKEVIQKKSFEHIEEIKPDPEPEKEKVVEVEKEEIVEIVEVVEVVEVKVEEKIEIIPEVPEVKVTKPKNKPITKENNKTEVYTRAHAFCDALPGRPKTLTEIAEKAKELYDKIYPNKKQPKFIHIEWDIKMHYLTPLIILGVVILDNGKYSLK